MTAATRQTHDAEPVAIFEIARTRDGWTIFHGGQNKGSLASKIAAWDAAMSAAFPSMLAGSGVIIKVAGDETRSTSSN